MPPIRNTRVVRPVPVPKRQTVKAPGNMNENSTHASMNSGVNVAKSNVTAGAAGGFGPKAVLKKHATTAPSRGILGEVTNATSSQEETKPEVPGVITRRGSKNEKDTPQEQNEQASPEVFTTPGETFEEDSDEEGEVEMMELDTTVNFTGSSGRTVDLATGKELTYDLSKLVDYDGPNQNKIEEYSNYVEDVFRYYRQRELDPQFMVDPNYIERQKDINWAMRAILVDWIVDLQENFALSHETLYLSVKLVDLYLTKSQTQLSKDKLQLLGITSVFIASKYEERNYVRVDDLVYMTEDSYTCTEVFKMEIDVLKTIGFQLGHAMSYRFLRRFAKTKHLTMETLTLARYVLETSLMDNSFLGLRESHLAAGVLFLARKMLKHEGDVWDDTLIHYSAVDRETARQMALKFNAMLRKQATQRKNLVTVQTKYEHPVFLKVATIPKISDEALI